MRRWALLCISALLASGLDSVALAQDPGTLGFAPDLFGALEWRGIGPDRGGRSLASAGSPSRPHEYYFGAVGGGLWKTTDGGTTWSPVTDGWIQSSSVGAVAVSASHPDVVYIGTGEVQMRGNMLQGDGVYGSRDGGATWEHLGLERSRVISRVRVHPNDPDLVYAAAFGSPWVSSEERGLYRSRDGGDTWERILDRGPRAGAVDLSIDRSDPDVLFAAFWEAVAAPGGAVASGGPGSGLFRSVDGGESWTEITRAPGLPSGTIGKIGVAVSPADGRRVYAIVEADSGGVFRSDDRGDSWARVNDEGPVRQRPPYFNRVVADPLDPDGVYALNLNLFRSTDGGRTFTTIRTPHVDYHDLWIAPQDPRRMIVSSDGGGAASVNGGRTWTEHDFPTAQLYHVVTTADVPYHVCGAQQDANTICLQSTQTPWRSRNPVIGAGSLGGPVYQVGGGESGTIAPHPTDPEVFFATGPQSVITRYDRRTGLAQARDVQPSPRWDRAEGAERFTWTPPLVFSPQDPGTLYAASQHVWRTRDGGQSWERISPDLSAAGEDGASGSSSILALAPSPHDPATIWAGSEDGLVHVTRDGGRSWQRVTPPQLPLPSRVSMIEPSPYRAGTVYLAAKRYEWGDRGPYLFRTDDFGETWAGITAGLADGDFVHAIRADPERSGLLFAGTEHGVRVSFDDGASWHSLSLGLPDTPVPDLAVRDDDLVIATHGRSFWVLDGIGPLRQLPGRVSAESVQLLEPAPAMRSLEPATIDYYLPRSASDLTLEILDGGGAVVRTLARAPGTRGLNRVTWNLRYQGATVFPGMIMWVGQPVGPLAPPGAYTLRLTVAGRAVERSLLIVRDPRGEGLTDADLRAQFELALSVRDRVSAANEGVLAIRNLADQIRDRLGASADSRVRGTAEDVLARIAAVEGELYQVRLRSQLDATIHPIKLNNRLANLMLSIETGDGPPTEQHRSSFRELSSELDAQLARLAEVVASELPRLNALLRAEGLQPVAVSGSARR